VRNNIHPVRALSLPTFHSVCGRNEKNFNNSRGVCKTLTGSIP
jgi:hypothetical protein